MSLIANYSVEDGEKNSSRNWNHGADRIVNHVETFYVEVRKVSGRKPIQSQDYESQFVPGWTDLFPFKNHSFPLFGIKYLSLKDLGRQGSISFTKHKRPISSEDLEVLYTAKQILQKVLQVRDGLTPFSTFGRRGRENQREMKPGDLQLRTTTSRLK